MVRWSVFTKYVIVCTTIAATAALLVLFGQDPKSNTADGDIIPVRQVSDPYPVFNGIAIDPENNLVAMSDVNRKSLMSYSRVANSSHGEITAAQHQIFGPLTN